MEYDKNFGFKELTDREREVLQNIQKLASSCDEVTLYLLVDGLGGAIWHTEHHASRGRVKLDAEGERQLVIARRQIEVAVDHTTRFGVPEPPRNAATGIADPAYWMWFRWWDVWKKGLSDDEWRTFDGIHSKARAGDASNEAYHHLLPEGRWNDKGGGS